MKHFLRQLQNPLFAHVIFLRCLVPACVLSLLSCFLAIRVNDIEIIMLSSHVLATVGLLTLVPSTRRCMPFRLPILWALVGLSALSCVVRHDALNLSLIVLAIAFSILPPNDPPDDRKGDKVRREQLKWSPDLEAAT